MEFDKEFEHLSRQMSLDFKRASNLARHPVLTGDSAEDIVRTFLRMYLPANLEVSTGKIFDTDKNVSKQLDVIIHDRDKTPVLYVNRSKDIKLIPVECVYAVIEVKSFLNKKELMKPKSGIYDNMLSVRRMTKKAFYSPGIIITPTDTYGKENDHWPINYFVFAFDSIKLETLSNYMATKHVVDNMPPECRIDMVCVLGKGNIINKTKDGKYSPCPEPESSLVYIYSQQELLLFYALMSHLMLQTVMYKFKFLDYIPNIHFGVSGVGTPNTFSD